jgi:hypothetical protein
MKFPKAFFDLLDSVLLESPHFPRTHIFEEGWMLRILMHLHAQGKHCLPIEYLEDSFWYSEAQIQTPFKPRYRGDPLSESRTHTDGAFGHFTIDSKTKSGLRLKRNARQFIVLEAKMRSGLSKGVTNAPFYDQASRTIACMAREIQESKNQVENRLFTGFYIIAPRKRIQEGIFKRNLDIATISEKVKKRVDQYEERKDDYAELLYWQKNYFDPLLHKISLKSISFESLIENLDREVKTSVEQFYQSCIDFNL